MPTHPRAGSARSLYRGVVSAPRVCARCGVGRGDFAALYVGPGVAVWVRNLSSRLRRGSFFRSLSPTRVGRLARRVFLLSFGPLIIARVWAGVGLFSRLGISRICVFTDKRRFRAVYFWNFNTRF